MKKKALCIDLDGTLIHSDILIESLFSILKKNPLDFFKLLKPLIAGRFHFKVAALKHSEIHIESLPYNQDVLNFIKNNSEKYEKVILVTGAPLVVAKKVAKHLSIFDEVFASDNGLNLVGKAKADMLCDKMGTKEFDYIGNSSQDIPVWNHSDQAYVVNNKKFKVNHGNVSGIGLAKDTIPLLIKLIRPQQWAKNLLIFLPLMLSHNLSQESIINCSMAFLSFCFIASTVYTLNDLFDIPNDRTHHKKKLRPLASGHLSIPFGFAVLVILLTLSIAIAVRVDTGSVFLLTYLFLNILYSSFLKKELMVDILLLSSFYIIRILYGGAVASVPVSYWLLSFSFFIFLSLAFNKRYSELMIHFKASGIKNSKGRGYNFEDAALLQIFGVGTGLISVLLLCLYFHFGEALTMYSTPEFLWGIEIVILYWISRIWFLAARGKMEDDPVKFALTDPVSLFLALIVCILGFLAK